MESEATRRRSPNSKSTSLFQNLVIMKLVIIVCAFLLAISSVESSAVLTKDLSNTAFIDSPSEDTSALRMRRSMKEDIEKGFKEFSDKVSKLPDQLTGSIKKYFEEKGISMESIQKILNDIWEAVQKLIDEVKKAM